MHRDILTTRTIKFPENKSIVLMRGGIVSRKQLNNTDGDKVVVDNLTFGIARRILHFADLEVCLNDMSVHVKNGDESGLEYAYTDDAFINHENSETIIEQNIDTNNVTEHTKNNTIEEDDTVTESTNEEIPEPPSFMIPKEDIDESDDEDAMITRVPQPHNNNHKNKKHHR